MGLILMSKKQAFAKNPDLTVSSYNYKQIMMEPSHFVCSQGPSVAQSPLISDFTGLGEGQNANLN